MSVIVIGGEKGGTGKSTTTTNLAVMASYMGHDVAVVDATSRQSSTFKFFNRRKALEMPYTPSCYRIQGKYLHAELGDLDKRYKYVLVDVGGYESHELRSAMGCASVQKMLSPFKPAEFDLETVEAIEEIAYLAKPFNPNLSIYAIFNQIDPKGKAEVVGAQKMLTSYDNIIDANLLIFSRKNVYLAPKNAQCVIEYEEEIRQAMPAYRIKPHHYKASIEFISLYKFVFNEDFHNPKFKTLMDHLKNTNNLEQELANEL